MRLGGSPSVAFDVHLEDGGVVNEAINCGEGHGRVGEDLIPFPKGWLAVMSSDLRSYRGLISSNRTDVSAWSRLT